MTQHYVKLHFPFFNLINQKQKNMFEPSDSPKSDGPDPPRPHSPTSPNPSPRSPAKTHFSAIGRAVAEFLAPPPKTAVAEATSAADSDRSQGLAGLRNDLAEIGGSLKSGLSLLSGKNAVAEISRIASSLLQFGDDDDRVLGGDCGGSGRGVPGINDEVLDFVAEISTVPECWTDFPLALENDFEMSDPQRKHAMAIEHLAPSLKNLRVELQSRMSQGQFWRIYFILLLSRLNEQDFVLLSTPKITEVRDAILRNLRKNTKHEKLVDSGESKTLGTSEDATETTQGENIVGSEVPNSGKGKQTDDAVGGERSLVHEDYFSVGGVEGAMNNLSDGWSLLEPMQGTGMSSPAESDEWIDLDQSQIPSKVIPSTSRESGSDGSDDWINMDFD